MRTRPHRVNAATTARQAGLLLAVCALLFSAATVTLTAALTTAPAGADCFVPESGTYVGSFSTASGPYDTYGSVIDDITYSGSQFTAVVTDVQGRTTLTDGTTYTGTINCDSSFYGTGDGGSVWGASTGPTSFAGTWTDSSGDTGPFETGLVEQSVSAPSTTEVSTGNAVSSSDPVAATVQTATPGSLSVSTALVGPSTLPGYSMLGVAAEVDAPMADDNNPLQLTFTLDPSALNGTDPSDVVIFENGSPAAQWCAVGAPPIDPSTDPCEIDPPSVDPGTGDVTFTILSTEASVWTFGVGCGFSIESSSLPATAVGERYSASVLACGGKHPLKFTKTGKLPRGLKLNKTSGIISGTPKTAGTYSFTIKLADSSKPRLRVTRGLSISVGP